LAYKEAIAEFLQYYIYKNSAIYVAARGVSGYSGGLAFLGVGGSVRMPLVANDYIYIRTYQNSGSARQLASDRCRFSIAKVA